MIIYIEFIEMYTNRSGGMDHSTSEVQEQIEGESYSMRFDPESHQRSSITEMISGSHQASQSKNKPYPEPRKMKKQEPKPIPEEPENVLIEDHVEYNANPIYLGDRIYQTVRERFFQVNKIMTNDVNVLYDFFFHQAKAFKQNPNKKPITYDEIEKLFPSMQRKMLVKKEFERILQYYPSDVFYSLNCYAAKIKHDEEQNHKMNALMEAARQKNKKRRTNKEIEEAVNCLYLGKKIDNKSKGEVKEKQEALKKGEQGKKSSEQIQKENRRIFGSRLSELFQNANRQKGQPYCIETLEKLYSYWEDIYQKDQYGIEWVEDTAQDAIKLYMYDQVDDLLTITKNKLGYKIVKSSALKNFYQQNQNLKNIHIPFNSLKSYCQVYNELEQEQKQQKEKQAKDNNDRINSFEKKQEVKKFGRPVSATPLTILSKPKKSSALDKNIIEKYSNDKLIKGLLAEEKLKKARYAFEYGVYDAVEEIKIQQWVKPDPKNSKVKYEQSITKMLFNPSQHNNFQDEKDQLSEIFEEDYLETDQKWKQLGPILHEAMLVKAYEQKDFVKCIIDYVYKTTKKKLNYETNQTLFKELFKYFNELDEQQRGTELHNLHKLIMTTEAINQRTKKVNELNKEKAGNTNDEQQKAKVYKYLQSRAIQYVKLRNSDDESKHSKETIPRIFMNDIFRHLLKNHRNFVKKQFHVLDYPNKKPHKQGASDQPLEIQCPKLLKYEFYRLVREINPKTLKKGKRAKSFVWLSTSKSPEPSHKIHQKTFQAIHQISKKLTGSDEKKHKQTIWDRDKAKDREKLLMTFDDAQECVFHPKISKMP